MTPLGVCLTLCALLTLSRAMPMHNATIVGGRHSGICEYEREQSSHLIGAFVPQCDANGDFLPQQCSGSTGYCWCVDVLTGVEIPNTLTPPGAIPVDCSKDYLCPYGWTRFGKRCFIFIDSMKTWAEAEGYCLFEEANLASIHSYEENHFVQSLTRGDSHDFPQTWIGGQDAVQTKFWMWSDGSKFYYENWCMEYDMEGNCHCLTMNYGLDWKWMSAACNMTFPFVCSKRI